MELKRFGVHVNITGESESVCGRISQRVGVFISTLNQCDLNAPFTGSFGHDAEKVL